MTNPEDTLKFALAQKTFSVDALSVRVYDCEANMAQDAAQLAQDYLQDAIARQGSAAIILATGNSQIKFLDALIAKDGINWSKITLFHLDEYLGIEAEHPASFRHYLRQRVGNQVRPAFFHYIEGDAMQPLDECDRYTQLLQQQPIDLCCLGLGENGHLAFNEPALTSFNETRKIKLVKLDHITRQQQLKQGHFPYLEAVPQYAFTLTIPMICSVEKIFCLAPEKRKALPVKNLLQGEISTAIPSSVLRQQQQATLFIDLDAASLL